VRASSMGGSIGVAQPAAPGTLWRPNPPAQAGFTAPRHARALVLALAVMRPIVSMNQFIRALNPEAGTFRAHPYFWAPFVYVGD
jgi:hypothetical protein